MKPWAELLCTQQELVADWTCPRLFQLLQIANHRLLHLAVTALAGSGCLPRMLFERRHPLWRLSHCWHPSSCHRHILRLLSQWPEGYQVTHFPGSRPPAPLLVSALIQSKKWASPGLSPRPCSAHAVHVVHTISQHSSASRARRPKGNPVPGSITGAHKYRDLVLQVESWIPCNKIIVAKSKHVRLVAFRQDWQNFLRKDVA
jgi:hypothetical protein